MPNDPKLKELAEEIKKNGYQLLSRILAEADTKKFETAIRRFVLLGGDINDRHNNGSTILDLCNFLNVDQSRKTLIIELGGEISGVHQMTAQPILPGANDLPIFDAIRGFSYENRELQTVAEYRTTGECNTDYQNQVTVCDILNTRSRSIGRLFDNGNFVSTLFLIKDDWIITARHSVNDSELKNLTVMFNDSDFDEDSAISVIGVIENGEEFGSDYIILKLSKVISTIEPFVVSPDTDSTSLLFVGYDNHSVLKFSAFPEPDSLNSDKLLIVGYQGTGAYFSGSPYINLNGEASGLHLCASSDQKTGIYFKTIIANNPDGALARLSRKEDVSNLLLPPVEYFPHFSSALTASEIDERGHFKISVDMSTGTAVFRLTGGPNNQSGVGVKKKIADRLTRLEAAGKTLTDVQKRFLAIGGNYANTSTHNIQIAHNVAISALRDALEHKMNTPLVTNADETAEIEAVRNFADAIASSDDEDPSVPKRSEIKKKLPGFIRNIRTAQKQPGGMNQTDADKLKRDCIEILTLCNKCSRNLMPGHAEVNEHEVGSCRDPHLTKNGGAYEETDISKTLAQTAATFFGQAHEPRKKADGSGYVASSSVDSGNVRGQSYYKP